MDGYDGWWWWMETVMVMVMVMDGDDGWLWWMVIMDGDDGGKLVILPAMKLWNLRNCREDVQHRWSVDTSDWAVRIERILRRCDFSVLRQRRSWLRGSQPGDTLPLLKRSVRKVFSLLLLFLLFIVFVSYCWSQPKDTFHLLKHCIKDQIICYWLLLLQYMILFTP